MATFLLLTSFHFISTQFLFLSGFTQSNSESTFMLHFLKMGLLRMQPFNTAFPFNLQHGTSPKSTTLCLSHCRSSLFSPLCVVLQKVSIPSVRLLWGEDAERVEGSFPFYYLWEAPAAVLSYIAPGRRHCHHNVREKKKTQNTIFFPSRFTLSSKSS